MIATIPEVTPKEHQQGNSYQCLQKPLSLANQILLQHLKINKKPASLSWDRQFTSGKLCFVLSSSPKRTGWMQLERMVNASMTANSFTIDITGMLEVNIIASFSWKTITINQNRNPTAREVKTETVIENLAPLALPAPSSLATRTLSEEIINWL